MFTPFQDDSAEPPVRGFLHEPTAPNTHAVLLTHGAGANCQTKLLVEISDALAQSGFLVLRYDLPFRLARPTGPPRPGSAARDREGIRRAVSLLRARFAGRVFLGGHSYGGRQSSMLLADEPEIADGLLLLSYPLHPPRKPLELRTKHFPHLTKPAFFVHGSRDLFATIGEMRAALELIPARKALLEVENVGHELLPKKSASDLPQRMAREFLGFMATTNPT